MPAFYTVDDLDADCIFEPACPELHLWFCQNSHGRTLTRPAAGLVLPVRHLEYIIL